MAFARRRNYSLTNARAEWLMFCVLTFGKSTRIEKAP